MLSIVLLLLLVLSFVGLGFVRVEVVPHSVQMLAVDIARRSESGHALLAGETVAAILQWDDAIALTQLGNVEAGAVRSAQFLVGTTSNTGHLELRDVGLVMASLGALLGRGRTVVRLLLLGASFHGRLHGVLLRGTKLLLGLRLALRLTEARHCADAEGRIENGRAKEGDCVRVPRRKRE